ncbi:MAG: asparagine synthase (glutamine-hydrolyzing), partial [Armatimonadetes bacterium]|nr:asparagine synthase (glutamine-hydrolyzing) [Armatimonadota bacterium]
NQPFQAGHKWIAFNGELYNYIEVRRELAEAGESFRTTSDTEVLVKALDRLGEEVLDRCEGMWAFAVYDEADGSVTLSRDRFGEKPLFLYRTEDGLYFASEVKFLLALLGRRLPVNYDHLYRYLVNGYKALYKERHTFFQGLEELPSGHVMRVEADGTTSSRRYWTPEVHLDERMTWEEAVQGTRERLLRAVEIRLRADVPLAFCMSGGVDSNGLISIAKKVFDYDVHGFTIMNSDARYDEQELVEHTIQQLGIRHTPIPVDVTEFLARMRTLVNYHDSPVSTISYYAHWLLMGSIAEHGYRISISGSAADELFTGYYDHHLAYLYEVRNDPDWHALSQRNWETHILPVVRNPFLRNPDLFIQDPAFRDHIFLDAEGFAAYLTQEWFEPFAESRYCDSLLRNRMLNELFHEAVPVILHEDDHNAMFYSIENRSPYLDRPLFEFCNTIPSRHLMRNGMAKAVLREALRGIAPDRVIDNRTKVGFNAPIYSFLDVNNPEVRSALLDPSPVFDIVRRPKIEELIARPDLPNSQSKFLFYFISTKMFLEEFAA